jgi:DNA processing protein
VDLPAEAHLMALLALPRMGTVALRSALADATPAEAWARVPDRRGIDPARLWDQHLAAGITVLRGTDLPMLADDPDPPFLLFARGELTALARRRAAIVGTRRCTEYGRGVSHRLGRQLAAAGAAVVSGLALGVDGAAHQGALEAGDGAPVGVVGSGLDVVYPRAHRRLWAEVAERGLLVSEYPLGTRPDRWRFPARNRLIAALSEVVVVVESRRVGGSLHTANDAVERDRSVFAVPGPITSDRSVGTNRLLADGAHPMCCAQDVLEALGLVSPDVPDGPPEPGGPCGRVLDATAWEAVPLEVLANRTGLPLPELALAVDRLCRDGWLVDRDGRYQRTTPRSGP